MQDRFFDRRLVSLVALSAILALPIQLRAAVANDPAKSAKDAEKAAKKAEKEERKKQKELVRQYGLGPYPAEIEAFVSTKPEPLRPLYKALYVGGERNAVLNFQRLGLAALEHGHWLDAEKAFDGALDRIEAVYANNKQAEAARSIFHKESNKDFKGEPYERAMAYYYRGLLYLRAGDYDNARASFKAAEYQDTVSEAEQFQSDFAAMNYLVGWTYQCQGRGSEAAEAFQAATKVEAALAAPAPSDNMLMIAELGRGPTKVRDGKNAEKLLFKAVEGFPETTATFDVLGKQVPGRRASSLYYQATTRGGRAIDGILAGKAAWKTGTGAAGDAAMMLGTQMMQQQANNAAAGSASSSMAGGMTAGFGMLMKLASSAMKPTADVRAWDGLPDVISVATARVKPDTQVQVRFAGDSGPVEIGETPRMMASAGKCSVLWTRSRSVAGLPSEPPGDDAGVAKAVKKKPEVVAKDTAFRATLAQN